MRKIYITTILVVFIVIVLNLLSNEFHFRIDLTQDQQYTLSDATKDILDDLEEPVTVKAYFSENLPPAIARARRDFQELLIEYAAKSDGMLQYEFIDPSISEATENEALQKGIQSIMITVREKDQSKQQKAFMGAIISVGNKQEVMSYIPPNFPIEYGLSSAIKKISVSNKTAIGFLDGHGEAPLSEMPQLYEQLDVLYTPRAVSLSDSATIPSDIRTLVIIRPTDTIPPSHLQQLDAFLASGGRIALAINRVDGNFQTAQATPVSNGFDQWLASKGIAVDPNLVVDARCAQVGMQQQTPFGVMTQQVPFPYLPVAGTFADHPVTKGLESITFVFASQVRYVGDTSIRFTPLLFSSDRSNALPAPLMLDVRKQWTEADLSQSNIAMAGAFEGKLSGNTQTRIVVIGDGDFPVNGSGQQMQRLGDDNVNIMSNAIDWLTDDTGLIELRTKGATSRPLDEMEEGTRNIVKYTNFLLPLVLVMIYGLFRFQRNRIRRLKRMSENYEED